MLLSKSSKIILYLPILLAFIVMPLAYSEEFNLQKVEPFSDPSRLANIPKEFLDKEIKYDKKVVDDVDVVISLGQQTYPAIHEVVEEIAREKGFKIEIEQGTCGATARKLLKKSVDIGTYCCPPGKTDRLPGLKFHSLGISPLVLVTHKENPLDDVSTSDAKKIFKGDYVSWKEVPGYQSLSDKLVNKRIQPVVRLHCKKRPGHWRSLLRDADNISPRAHTVGTIPDMIAQVANNHAAIGYETPYMLKVHEDKGHLKVLSIDGISHQDEKKILNGDYPIYRSYSLTTWTNKNNKNEKADILMNAIFEHIQKNGGQYSLISANKLKAAGWKFKETELIGEPDGQAVITEH